MRFWSPSRRCLSSAISFRRRDTCLRPASAASLTRGASAPSSAARARRPRAKVKASPVSKRRRTRSSCPSPVGTTATTSPVEPQYSAISSAQLAIEPSCVSWQCASSACTSTRSPALKPATLSQPPPAQRSSAGGGCSSAAMSPPTAPMKICPRHWGHAWPPRSRSQAQAAWIGWPSRQPTQSPLRPVFTGSWQTLQSTSSAPFGMTICERSAWPASPRSPIASALRTACRAPSLRKALRSRSDSATDTVALEGRADRRLDRP